jgi:EmrB/QacA subfamily drug resistance transporter
MALLVVAGGMMLSVVNTSIVNVALPLMADDLGVDVAAIGWVVTGFLVTQATLLAIAGRAGDLYGRNRVFMIGLVLLSASSVLCAIAPTAPFLVAFRIVQGIGASVMAPSVFATVGELFAPVERGRAMGLIVGIISAGPVLALALSGVLVSLAGWRSVFWFSPLVGVVVLAAAALVLDDAPPSSTDTSFDLPGAALAALGLFPLLLAFSRLDAWGPTSGRTLTALAVGAAGLAAFVWREARAREPMIDLSLFRLRSLTTANIASLAGAATLFGVLIVLPFYLSAVLGFGPIRLTLAIIPVALTYMIVSPLSGRALVGVGADRLAMSGYALAAIGVLWLAIVAGQERYALLVPGIVGLSAGLALATTPITTTAISEVPRERLGVASAFPNISRYTGGAFGAAIMSAVMTSALPAGVALSDPLTGPERHDVALGFQHACAAGLVFLIVALVAAWRMPRFAGLHAAPAIEPVRR